MVQKFRETSCQWCISFMVYLIQAVDMLISSWFATELPTADVQFSVVKIRTIASTHKYGCGPRFVSFSWTNSADGPALSACSKLARWTSRPMTLSALLSIVIDAKVISWICRKTRKQGAVSGCEQSQADVSCIFRRHAQSSSWPKAGEHHHLSLQWRCIALGRDKLLHASLLTPTVSSQMLQWRIFVNVQSVRVP